MSITLYDIKINNYNSLFNNIIINIHNNYLIDENNIDNYLELNNIYVSNTITYNNNDLTHYTILLNSIKNKLKNIRLNNVLNTYHNLNPYQLLIPHYKSNFIFNNYGKLILDNNKFKSYAELNNIIINHIKKDIITDLAKLYNNSNDIKTIKPNDITLIKYNIYTLINTGFNLTSFINTINSIIKSKGYCKFIILPYDLTTINLFIVDIPLKLKKVKHLNNIYTNYVNSIIINNNSSVSNNTNSILDKDSHQFINTTSSKNNTQHHETLELLDKKLTDNIIKVLYLIINELDYVLSSYNKFKTLTNDKHTILEHIIFNISYNFAKKYNLPILDKYTNKFNQPIESIIKNNKYIALYYLTNHNLNKYNKTILNNLIISNIGLYSITKPYSSLIIKNEIINYINNKLPNKKISNLIITDGTAGVGGDTFTFLKMGFKKVNSVEITKTHYTIIKHNMAILNKESDKHRLNLINNDYTKIYNTLEQDIIFIDSPWGGTEYKESGKTELYMFGTNLKFNDFIKFILKQNITLFIKSPINYDVEQLHTTLYDSKSTLNINTIEVKKISNYLLICI